MPVSIEEQVIDFYHALFERVFSAPFRGAIRQPLRRNAVIRQVEGSADAASQSLTRFFLNQQLTAQQVTDLLGGFQQLGSLLQLGDVANPNVTPESVADRLLGSLPCPQTLRDAAQDATYRVALHSTVQVLMLVGPVMAEWQKLSFSSTFELPNRVVNRLNQISQQIDALGRSGPAAADERYELTHRDYLLQRFHRVEAGTVRMTTNLDVDLRELFVMPRVQERPGARQGEEAPTADAAALMDLADARAVFADRGDRRGAQEPADDQAPSALEQVKRSARLVVIGAPGVGKSTFFEWLQVKLASAEEPLPLAGQQAIPMLLRVRQLDLRNLPRGAALVEKATASADRATMMPAGWIDRQMKAGRVLLMLDGLDETEPALRDGCLLPWLAELCQAYPACRYLVSSRPVGYPPGSLTALGFVECDLLDFDAAQVRQYTAHWCTAIRLARNEAEEEARREGAQDGQQIVERFQGHPYIRNLARNPLMLSAICLVNYFEGGQLPKDRAVLYRLCVEGLLHHWDQRRGIRSEFAFEEKLRTCRELALAMQADDRAEYEKQKVHAVFASVLGDPVRAESLLEHVRYRTGLLLERRPEVFAFAHLTFQEYLAARAVHEGNRLGVDAPRLVREHADGRWQEVIALYCGVAPAPAARDMIASLIEQPDTRALGEVLTEAFLAASPEVSQDARLRQMVMERIARAPSGGGGVCLVRFPADEAATVANRWVGRCTQTDHLSGAFTLLQERHDLADLPLLRERLAGWREMTPLQITEVLYLLHRFMDRPTLRELASSPQVYDTPGPKLPREEYGCQAEIGVLGLWGQGSHPAGGEDFQAVWLRLLQAILRYRCEHGDTSIVRTVLFSIGQLFGRSWLPARRADRAEFASVAQELARHIERAPCEQGLKPHRDSTVAVLRTWADQAAAIE